MDVFLPRCRCQPFRLKVAARMKQWGKALVIPEDAAAVSLEVLKFLATVALIAVNGVILLMLE